MKNALIAFLALGNVALAACLLFGSKTPSPAPAAEKPKPKASAPIPAVPDALERALRRRIRQLEGELAEARSPATNGAKRVEIHPIDPKPEARPQSPRQWMENLKKNDPKRYEEMKKRMTQMRQRHFERTKGRLDYFGSIDTSGMSEAERANHEKLQELLVQRENLPEPSENMTDEEMREAGRQRHELDRAIRQANQEERKTLLNQTASALGLQGEDATEMIEAVQGLIQATESDHGPHGQPPPPPQ